MPGVWNVLYSFPRASLMNYFKYGGLKMLDLYSHSSGDRTSKVKVSSGLHSPWEPWGSISSLPLPASGGSWHSLAWNHTALCLFHYVANSSLCVSLCLSLIKIFMMTFRVYLIILDKLLLLRFLISSHFLPSKITFILWFYKVIFTVRSFFFSLLTAPFLFLCTVWSLLFI